MDNKNEIIKDLRTAADALVRICENLKEPEPIKNPIPKYDPPPMPQDYTKYPFDLQRALAGEELVTRDGRKVTKFGERLSPIKKCYQYKANIEDDLFELYYTIDGYFYENKKPHPTDLFMLHPPKEKEEPKPEPPKFTEGEYVAWFRYNYHSFGRFDSYTDQDCAIVYSVSDDCKTKVPLSDLKKVTIH